MSIYALPESSMLMSLGSLRRSYIADSGNNRILVVDLPSGEFICEIGHEEGEGKLFNPTGLHLAAEFLYVSDDDNCRNVIYSTSGELVATMQRETGGGTPFFKGPCKFTADRNGHIYSLGAFGKYTKFSKTIRCACAIEFASRDKQC